MRVVLEENAKLEKQDLMDAGYDMCNTGNTVQIGAGASAVVETGVSVEIPKNLWGILTHRSSLAFKKRCILSFGVIDTSFRGPIKALVFNLGNAPVTIEKGERFAQLIVVPHVHQSLEKVGSLETGKDGYGSSGKY